jgi:hypothetical protein
MYSDYQPTSHHGHTSRKAATSTADDKAKQMFEEMFTMAVKVDTSKALELKKKWEREFGKVEGSGWWDCEVEEVCWVVLGYVLGWAVLFIGLGLAIWLGMR